MFDDFDTQVQIDEIVPEEYEEYDHFEEDDEDHCFEPGRSFISIFELNP